MWLWQGVLLGIDRTKLLCGWVIEKVIWEAFDDLDLFRSPTVLGKQLVFFSDSIVNKSRHLQVLLSFKLSDSNWCVCREPSVNNIWGVSDPMLSAFPSLFLMVIISVTGQHIWEFCDKHSEEHVSTTLSTIMTLLEAESEISDALLIRSILECALPSEQLKSL